jgi:hypothetical protein
MPDGGKDFGKDACRETGLIAVFDRKGIFIRWLFTV